MNHKLCFSLSTGALLFLACLFFPTDVFCQGKLVGHVKDKKGEPLVGANVIILATPLGAAADKEGDYVIVNAPVGTYSVQASMVGSKKVVQTDVVISLGRTTRVDFELEEAAFVAEEVVVTAQRNILHKEVANSQIVVNTDQIRDAAGVRTLEDFVSTQAGVTNTLYLNIREGNPQETGTLVNGLTFVNARAGKSESFLPTSAIEQVSLRTGGMTAEYGDFRSGIIDVTTKMGRTSGYHGTFTLTRNLAEMKRFGRSLYDPMNNNLRPHLDPDIAFIGVDAAVSQGIISSYEKNQFSQYSSFAGWISRSGSNLPSTWKAFLTSKGLPLAAVTPVDLYLYDAWMHTVKPDFAKLNAAINSLNAQGKNVGDPVTDQGLIDLFDKHAGKEGRTYDYDFDGGFGGPVPLVGEYLGDATFYVSNITKRNSYIQPMEKDYDLRSTTLLVLRSDITKTISLRLTGAYGYTDGINPARGADAEVPNLGIAIGMSGATGGYTGLDRGNLMPEDNIPLFVSSGSNYGPIYWWYPTMLQEWVQKNYMVGMNLTHTISATTFYDLNISYQKTKDLIDPGQEQMRDPTVLTHFGPIPVTEMPYGRRILGVNVTADSIEGWPFDYYYSIPGISERFDSKGGVVYDHSSTQQLRIKANFGSQIDKWNYIRTGAELYYVDMDNKRWSYWPAQDYLSLYEYNFRTKPYTLSAYAQDEISFEWMVANVGVRMDYYSIAGGLKWPTGRPFDALAFGPPNTARTPVPSDYFQILQSGRSIIWERWNYLNDSLVNAGATPLLQPVKSHLVFSPRIGISFPITERAKFYFNYGHFRSLPPYSELFMYDYRYDTQKGGLYALGNPNLEPSKTIQYELGVDYNLLNNYLIHVAGYYKDVTGEVRTLTYNTSFVTYGFRTNDRYRDIEGVELQVTKQQGDIFTGWAKLQYVYASSGNAGRSTVYQDSVSNTNDQLVNYYGDPTRPDPVPQASGNLTFRSPESWGYFLGDWRLSVMPSWIQGAIFRYNPRGLDVNNEFRWPNQWNVNVKLGKTFDLTHVKATVYVNVNNLINTKTFLYNYAFNGGLGSATSPGSDFKDYMASLHLSQYRDSYYDPIRSEGTGAYLYAGYTYTRDVTDQYGVAHKAGELVQGEDKVGDVRSSGKPLINDPNIDIFSYGNPRSIWFGIKLDF